MRTTNFTPVDVLHAIALVAFVFLLSPHLEQIDHALGWLAFDVGALAALAFVIARTKTMGPRRAGVWRVAYGCHAAELAGGNGIGTGSGEKSEP